MVCCWSNKQEVLLDCFFIKKTQKQTTGTYRFITDRWLDGLMEKWMDDMVILVGI